MLKVEQTDVELQGARREARRKEVGIQVLDMEDLLETLATKSAASLQLSAEDINLANIMGR